METVQIKEIQRGESYQIGERIYDTNQQERLILDNNLERTILVDCKVRDFHSQDSIQLITYDCTPKGGDKVPAIISCNSYFEFDQEEDFNRYKKFIQQHGGTQ